MIRLRPAARNDIRAIAAYLEQESQSPSIRRRFLASFEESCFRYEEWPATGARVDLGSDELFAVRRFAVHRFPNYLAFYREMEDGILIERVLHGMRDLPLLLRD